MWRGPPGHSEVPVPRGSDLVAVGAEVKVVPGSGVTANTAAVCLTQKVTADLSSPRHIGDVLAQTMADEELHFGAVVLREQD